MNIIGFAGPAGCGKDTAAKILVDHFSYVKVSFAAALKAALAAMGYAEPATQALKEQIIPDLGVSWRHMAQTLGTQWGRELVHPDIWVKAQVRIMKAAPDLKYVFTDVRFENEAIAIRRAGGDIIHLRGRKHEMAAATAGHASEVGIIEFSQDWKIDNSRPLEDLHDTLDCVLGQIAVSQSK